MLRDLGYALRLLSRRRGFTILSVTILAIGIALNTAVFSAVNALIRRPLPFPEASRLVLLTERNLASGTRSGTSYPAYLDWKQRSRSFEHVGAIEERSFNWTGAGEPESVRGARVSVSFLDALGMQPVLGRRFLADEDKPGSSQVALLSETFWRRRLGSSPGVLGSRVLLDGESYTVVGVLPRIDRSFYAGCSVWLPLPPVSGSGDRRVRTLQVVGRLKPGVPVEQARAEMEAVGRSLEQRHLEAEAGWVPEVRPMEKLSRGEVLPAFLVLLAAVGLVLLIVCANIANLQLARAASRRQEVAVRMALGATRRQVIQLLLYEGLLVALAGGAAGLLLAVWVRSILIASVPQLDALRIEGTVLGYTLLIACLAGLTAGLAPAMAASKVDLNATLKTEGRGLAGSTGRRLRNVLVVAQMAVALLLSVSSGLLMASFVRIHRADPGFRADGLVTMNLSLPQSRYVQPQQRAGFYQQALERLVALPGVQQAAAVSAVPLTDAGSLLSAEMDGVAVQSGAALPSVHYTVVSPNYFTTAGIRLLRGRSFSRQDREGAQPVAVVNERLARLHWPGQEPLGKRIRLAGGPWRTVVGVVADARQILIRPAGPEVYVTHAQDPSPQMALMVRTDGQAPGLISAIRREMHLLDANLPVSSVQTMDEIISGYLPGAMIVGSMVFAGVALLLAALGLYGVVSYVVAQRTPELGIRMALGATPERLRRFVLAQALRLTAVSVAIGLAGAFALTRVLSRVLFGVSASDAGIFAAAALVLAGSGLAASYFPARRATRLEPMAAVRSG